MRDILIHEYFGVNLKRIWIAIKKDLPELKKKILKILKEIQETVPPPTTRVKPEPKPFVLGRAP